MNFPYKIKYVKAAKYTLGRTEPVRVFVNHRMVGWLTGTDSMFQNPDNRGVSTNFGIGTINGTVEIHQYVPLDDTAWGNGNYDPSGVWDDWGMKTTEINPQTISIEHQDYGDPGGTGIVSESIQQASIALQALLLRGTLDEWKTAGVIIRDWTNNAPILQKELHAISPGPRTIITHNDISGKLKPYCWKPWSADTIGFPRQKYIDGINLILHPPVAAPITVTYTQAQLDTAVATATIPLNITIEALKARLETLQTQLSSTTSALAVANRTIARAKEAATRITDLWTELKA